ncbi:UDP-2,3-diacylglucosamine diphosphatase [Rhodobacter sp. KR11]|jgi:UDP-2,3-diacylglucosamine pyrophosphatase LpxH|uniref:UDP-2,3-diacylglucosamine diphosphatase n=1 Tax=Rhodobacter sp. KR11 TaxID=2974588 RepID=UPI0022222A56|nr:UDP-2,3-diacylglucosamine diphosphatase [Rhodobacter sp. KR11]MCW1917741.1 UDP-2,3-diacylglucosamine diphosphatase [Rhodobacter sp. KR11]
MSALQPAFPTDSAGLLAAEALRAMEADLRPDRRPLRASDAAPPRRHFPVLFLSDLHLGSRACREDLLFSFLQSHSADTIYLVGDILDTWMPTRHWSPRQQDILGLLLARATEGARLIYTPGNHDAFFRRFIGQALLGVEIVDRLIHETAEGQRLLVVHGDEGDLFETRFPRITRLVARIDGAFRGAVAGWNRLRAGMGLAPSGLAERVVKWVNDAARACDDFETRLSGIARDHQADGIICGHFHKPALHGAAGAVYANCGDWVENATALVETCGGRLQLIDWAAAQEVAPALAHPALGLEISPHPVHIGLTPA